MDIIRIIGNIFSKINDPKFLAMVVLSSGMLLFCNILPVQKEQIFIQNRPLIIIIFIISLSGLSIELMYRILIFLKEKYQSCRFIRQQENRLHNLTQEEKILLSGYIDNGTRSQDLCVDDGITYGLEEAMVISRASVLPYITHEGDWYLAYNIKTWAWEYLNKYPNLLKCNHSDLSQE